MIENEILTKARDERLIAWHNAIYRDGKGKIIGTLSSGEDITERKLAEEALKESEEKYRELIETTSEGFWLLNPEKKTIDVNQSLCDMLGYSRNNILGKTPFDFVDDANNKIFSEQLSNASSSKHRTYDISLKSKNGINIPTLINATSLFDNKEKFVGSFAFVTNISKTPQKILKYIKRAGVAV